MHLKGFSRSFFPSLAAALFLAISAAARPAPAEFVPGDRYFDTLTGLVDRSTASVVAYVYLYSLTSLHAESLPVRLADALGAAAARRVRVEVIFNSLSVLGGEEVDSLNDRNRAAAERLAQKGVRVSFEDAPALLHAKAVLVDGTAALLGSSNWSAKSWTENIETNLLLRDPAVLRPLAAYLGQIPRTPFVPDAADAVRLPASLLMSPTGLGLMSRRRAESAFDLYLWLLKESQSPGAVGPVRVPLETLADLLGKPHLPLQQKRFFVSRALRELQNRYGLVAVDFQKDSDALVTLLPLGTDTFSLSRDYWSFGWDRRLAFPGKLMLVLGRYHSERSPERPRWRRSKVTLERDHGVSESTLDRGTIELKRADLLEVHPSPLSPAGGPRPPNEYTPNPFYDPAVRAAARQALVALHGPDKVSRAARIAAAFYEDADIGAVEALIALENAHGPERIARAVSRVGAKAPDNPKRTIGYLIAVVRNPDRPAPALEP